MKTSIIALVLAGFVSNAFADDVTLRFLNCTGKELTAYWYGYRVNVDSDAGNSTLQGQIILPGDKLSVTHNLNVASYDVDTGVMSDHGFDLKFVQGVQGFVNFSFKDSYLERLVGQSDNDLSFVAWNVINLTASSNFYLPKTQVRVTKTTEPTPVVDIQIGCQ
ncbi:MAG: hypothetical protein M3R00_02340 [Pseudomonadota bacterium]|nr:hypothetical protein [Pseudomonadota bacterium]